MAAFRGRRHPESAFRRISTWRSSLSPFPSRTTHKRNRATGLGLAVYERFVKKPRGASQFESELGKGSRGAFFAPWERALEPAPKKAQRRGGTRPTEKTVVGAPELK